MNLWNYLNDWRSAELYTETSFGAKKAHIIFYTEYVNDVLQYHWNSMYDGAGYHMLTLEEVQELFDDGLIELGWGIDRFQLYDEIDVVARVKTAREIVK